MVIEYASELQGVRVPTLVCVGQDAAVSTLLALPGDLLAIGSNRGNVHIWDMQANLLLSCFPVHSSWVFSLVLCDADMLASGSKVPFISLTRLSTGVGCGSLIGHSEAVYCMAPLARGRLASGSRDHSVRIWNLETSVCLLVLSDHRDVVSAMCVLNEELLVSGSHDGTLKVWNIDVGTCMRTIYVETGVKSLCVLSDCRLAAGMIDGMILIIDSQSPDVPVRSLNTTNKIVFAMVELDDGRLVSGTQDGQIRVWDLSLGALVRTIDGVGLCTTSLAVLAGGLLVSASIQSDHVMLWR